MAVVYLCVLFVIINTYVDYKLHYECTWLLVYLSVYCLSSLIHMLITS